MPRGAEPKTPLSEREKLQLKQRGDNLRRRQGLGSAKYAEFFFRHRSAYPFTRKTFPSPMGRVEAGNEAWDGVDPETGKMADWVKSSTAISMLKHHHAHHHAAALHAPNAPPAALGRPANDDGCGSSWRNRGGAGRRIDDDLDACHYRLVKRLRSTEPQPQPQQQPPPPPPHHHTPPPPPPPPPQQQQQQQHPATTTTAAAHDYTANTAASHTPPSSPPSPSSSPSPKSLPPPPPDSSSSDPDPSPAPCRPIQRDLKLLMDALRRIPTPVRAARAIEGMLSRREVQRALEKYGTGAELGLSSKELAAISVLQNGVTCKSARW